MLREDAVSGVLAGWTLKRRHPGSSAPWHLCPELSTYLWLLQRAVICDREWLDPCTCGSFSPASTLVSRRPHWQAAAVAANGQQACC